MIGLLSIAWAQPRGEVEVHGAVALSAEREGETAVGAGGSIGIAPLRRLQLELGVDGGTGLQGSPWTQVAPRVRGYLGPPEKPVFSVFAGGGAAFVPDPRGFVALGSALDILRGNGPRPRLQFEYALVPEGGSRGILSLGIVFAPRAIRSVEPVEATVVDADQGMVWVPGPVCQWLPPPEANAQLDRLAMQLEEVSLLNERMLPGVLADAPDEPGPASLVVAVHRGDEVFVEGFGQVDVVDAVAVARLPEGRADLRIVGGGRVEAFPVGLVDGSAVWITAGSPEPVDIRFAVGSSRLDEVGLARLSEIATLSGGWHFEVSGTTSPEGTVEENNRLAAARAEAVTDALARLGVDRDRIRTGDPEPAAADTPIEALRAARLRPVEAP